MHEPKKIKPKSLSDYLENMTKPVFQTGISWQVVESKWPGIVEAFHRFDPLFVSHMQGGDIDKLMQDTRVIRNRRKLEAIILNARKMLELDKTYAGFRNYLRSFGSFEELNMDLKKQFKYLGNMGAYHFLWVVGEKVPPWEEWSSKYMVKAGAGRGTYPHDKTSLSG